MSANQEQIEARLAAYIDGELDANERAEIEKHLAGNPQHRKLIAELTIQRDLLQGLPREKAPVEIAETIQAQLERSVLLGSGEEEAGRGAMRIGRWPQFGAIAAILLLTAGLGFFVYKVLPSNRPPEFARQTGPAEVPLATEDGQADKSAKDTLATEGAGKRGFSSKEGELGTRPAGPLEQRKPEDTFAVNTPPVNAPPTSVQPNPEAIDAARANPAPSKAGPTLDDTLATSTPQPAPAPLAAPGAAPASPPVGLNEDSAKKEITDLGAGVGGGGGGGAAGGSGLAMNPTVLSNSLNVTHGPLIEAMKGGDAFNKDTFNFKSSTPALGGTLSSDVCLLVSTDDPTRASEQVRSYLADKQIAWTPTRGLNAIPQDMDMVSRMRDNREYTRRAGFDRAGSERAQAELSNRDSKTAISGKGDFSDPSNLEKNLAQKSAGEPTEQKLRADTEPATQPADALARAGGAGRELKQGEANTTASAPARGATGGQIAQLPELETQRKVQDELQQVQAKQLEQATAPTTGPVDEFVFYCPSVPASVPREMEVALSNRPGQIAACVTTPADANRAFDITPNAAALAPTTQTVASSAGQLNQSLALPDQSQATQLRTSQQAQAAPGQSQESVTASPQSPASDQALSKGNYNNGNFNGGNQNGGNQNGGAFNGGVSRQFGGQQIQQQGEKPVDLIILVRREASPTTQPDANEAVQPQPFLKAP